MKTSYKVLIAVSLVVGLIALAFGVAAFNHAAAPAAAPTDTLGGVYDTNNVAPNYVSGVDFGAAAINSNWAGGKIGAKLNSASWKNISLTTRYVDYIEVSTDGTASSTYKIYAFASTSPYRSIFDFVAPANVGGTIIGINGFQFATSTTATTTTNIDKALNGHTIQVPAGSSLNIAVVSPGIACPSQGGVCESATSTNRGFNIQWRIHYHN